MAALVPQSVGTLESTPFGELLVQALDHRLTGTLVLEETGGARHGIYLEAGAPQKAKVVAPVAHLGEVLVDTGAISSDVHEETLARALRDKILHGQLLLSERRITAQALGVGLREHLHRQLVWLFRQAPATHYGYFEGKDLLARWGTPARITPSTLEVLWRGLCDHAPADAIASALERVAGQRILLHPHLPEDHFAFMGDARRIVSLFEGSPRRLAELVAAEPALEGEIRRVLYFLLLTRSVDLGIPSAPPVGLAAAPVVVPPPGRMPRVSTTPPPPSSRRDSPSSLSPALVRSAALREELKRRLEKPPRTHYEVLGVPEDAPLRQVQAAFFLLSKHWHPDRLGPDVLDLKQGVASLFDRIATAHRVLSDPATRAAYDDDLTSGAGLASAPAVERSLNAELAFQKAESFLARGNLEGAEREARLALELEPGRGEHIALVAWLDTLKPGADERQLGVAFSKALRAAQTSAKVHFYRGLFLQRTGRHAAALQEFRYVCERDRRNIDAAREVRMYEQRLHHSAKERPSLAPEAPVSERSAWSRLFKRRS